jgi:hypothetical protein
MENNPNEAAVEAQAPQTEATPTTNSNQPTETAQAPAEAPKTPDLHGFTEEQLADMAKFYAANGGYDKVKSRLSNPQPQQQEQQRQQYEPEQPVQQQASRPPKGFASLQELSIERYFKDLAADPKYENISDQIVNGDVLKEMASMGMQPIDSNYNINVDQVNKFLALKSASVPAKPTTVEPTTTPTVDYIQMEGDNITSMNQALDIARQSTMLRAQGLQPHPAEAKALEYMKNNGFAQ